MTNKNRLKQCKSMHKTKHILKYNFILRNLLFKTAPKTRRQTRWDPSTMTVSPNNYINISHPGRLGFIPNICFTNRNAWTISTPTSADFVCELDLSKWGAVVPPTNYNASTISAWWSPRNDDKEIITSQHRAMATHDRSHLNTWARQHVITSNSRKHEHVTTSPRSRKHEICNIT